MVPGTSRYLSKNSPEKGYFFMCKKLLNKILYLISCKQFDKLYFIKYNINKDKGGDYYSKCKKNNSK